MTWRALVAGTVALAFMAKSRLVATLPRIEANRLVKQRGSPIGIWPKRVLIAPCGVRDEAPPHGWLDAVKDFPLLGPDRHP
jgi:hypothetical protein